MDDYLTKPIDLGLLCATVERWTHGQQEESAGGRAATGGLPENAGVGSNGNGTAPRLTESARGPGVGTTAPRISIVGRSEYERSAPPDEATSTASSAPSQWEQPFEGDPIDFDRLNDTSMGIPALREALLNTFLGDVNERVERLADAIQARDARRLEFEAHGLKGMSATIGARHCVVCFSELERCGRENDLQPAGPPTERARIEVDRVRTFIAAHLEGERKAA
jgi:HPt (histidine-containing phosphotransfer) domain-containing protein